MEVIAYLKKEDGQKDEEIDTLRQQVKDIQVKALNERDTLIAEHKEKVSQLEGTLSEKNEEVRISILPLAHSPSTSPSLLSQSLFQSHNCAKRLIPISYAC